MTAGERSVDVAGGGGRATSLADLASAGLRVALAAGFLSAVADRFGLWGPPGGPGVAWGDFPAFAAYSAKLTFYLPAALHLPAAWAATVAELLLGAVLLLGLVPRAAALLSGLLLTTFGLSMVVALGVKPALDYSVFPAAAAAFVLAARPPDRFALGPWLRRDRW